MYLLSHLRLIEPYMFAQDEKGSYTDCVDDDDDDDDDHSNDDNNYKSL